MLRHFLSYFRTYRRYLIGSIVCVALEAVFELIIPLIMADIIDIGVATRDKNYILIKSLAMVGCALASLLLGVFYARLAAIAGQGFGAELRKAEYQKVQSFSFADMDRFTHASLITRLTNDITVLQNAVCNGIRPIVRGPVLMVMGLVMTASMSPELTMVFLIAMPTLGVCLYLILKKLGPVFGKMQKMLDKVNAVVQENLTAIRTVKSYVRGESECGKFSEANENLRSASEQAFHYAVLNMPCLQFVMYGTIVSILWFGGNFINTGAMKVGELTGFLSYVMQILNSLMMISNVFLMLTRSMTSIGRIYEVTHAPAGLVSGPDCNTVSSGDIDFECVSFKYRETAKEYVLSDIDLHIRAGQTVGIIGGTGSAKSSLVQLIPRLYDVTSGVLKIDGCDVKEYPVPHLRDAIGMVLQKNTLFSGTIRENLLWGDEDATEEQLDWACHIACADEFLSRMPGKYDAVLGQGGVNLSGGQKQRLCIARALLKRPRILILDDSTSAVDTATEAKIRRRMARELKDTTKIIITQRISAIEDADLIVVLKEGKIDGTGTHGELLDKNPIYRGMYEFQRKGAIA
ncbi:MAG TPA: ABC transporter ATP-binding protein [Feifaniaceae bacterium]|nr:ABC transporter ATP-binding protein [Feifaniaceae bacterium]